MKALTVFIFAIIIGTVVSRTVDWSSIKKKPFNPINYDDDGVLTEEEELRMLKEFLEIVDAQTGGMVPYSAYSNDNGMSEYEELRLLKEFLESLGVATGQGLPGDLVPDSIIDSIDFDVRKYLANSPLLKQLLQLFNKYKALKGFRSYSNNAKMTEEEELRLLQEFLEALGVATGQGLPNNSEPSVVDTANDLLGKGLDDLFKPETPVKY